MTARTLALCADDFGLHADVDRGILRLAQRGRLSEVSCMANAPAWRDGAAGLAALPPVADGRLRLGLHFNLSEGEPLSPALRQAWPRLPTLPKLLVASHLRQLPVAALRDELQAQWAAFEAASGRVPAHIDGHQHVHHLPQIRDLVLDAVATRSGVRVRDTGCVRGPGHAFKRWVIQHSGGTRLRLALQKLGRQANTELFGVYGFDESDYRALMQAWLAALPARGALLFCHPGEGGGAGDPIAAARRRELAYFDSEAFAADLLAAGVQLGHAA